MRDCGCSGDSDGCGGRRCAWAVPVAAPRYFGLYSKFSVNAVLRPRRAGDFLGSRRLFGCNSLLCSRKKCAILGCIMKGGFAVKHAGKPSPLVWVAAAAACLAAAGLVWLGLTALTPAEEPSYLPTGNTAVTTVGTEVQAPTLPPTTTTTAPPEIGLSVTSHESTAVTTTEPVTVFRGTSDPAHPLTLNGKAVERTADGAFAVECTLSPGSNRFTFTHKDKTVTYTVRYNFTVITAHAPSKNQRYQSGATVNVLVTARRGSTVTATFNGKTITLRPDEGLAQNGAAESPTFVDYTGSFTLPADKAVRPLLVGGCNAQ